MASTKEVSTVKSPYTSEEVAGAFETFRTSDIPNGKPTPDFKALMNNIYESEEFQNVSITGAVVALTSLIVNAAESNRSLGFRWVSIWLRVSLRHGLSIRRRKSRLSARPDTGRFTS